MDDDTKGFLTAADFKSSYYRIRASTEADEPRSWFRLVEFMMIDEDGDGTIAFDEAAKMFRNRYGEPPAHHTHTHRQHGYTVELSTSESKCAHRVSILSHVTGKDSVESVQTMFKRRAGE